MLISNGKCYKWAWSNTKYNKQCSCTKYNQVQVIVNAIREQMKIAEELKSVINIYKI